VSWDQLTGWFDWSDLYDKLVERTPEYGAIVEVGVAHGRSLAYLARRSLDAKKLHFIIGVDRWLYVSWAEFQRGMAEHAPEELAYIVPMRARSLDAARAFSDKSLDAVWIDASHEYEHVRDDIEAWLPKVKPGGVIGGHDYSEADWPGVVRAVRERFGHLEPAGQRRYCWWVEV
jgi:SAM-dependent methyltransferase